MTGPGSAEAFFGAPGVAVRIGFFGVIAVGSLGLVLDVDFELALALRRSGLDFLSDVEVLSASVWSSSLSSSSLSFPSAVGLSLD
jgi:ABC-type polysaccharide transport system permease subunit